MSPGTRKKRREAQMLKMRGACDLFLKFWQDDDDEGAAGAAASVQSLLAEMSLIEEVTTQAIHPLLVIYGSFLTDCL